MNPTAVVETLSRILHSGRFVASGHLESAPLLKIDGFGTLPLPVVPALLTPLRSAGSAAPYGSGPDTVVDPAVRRCHQIAAEHVAVPPDYEHVVRKVAAQAGEALGVVGPVEARLYKLLIYGPGDFFVAHRDTEKEPGMFGTLVLSLPSELEGDELAVRHGGGEERVDPRPGPSGTSWVAFYADCSHEVLPVRSGVRVALVYNLVRAGAPTGPQAEDPEVARRLEQALSDWGTTGPVKLVYVLDHRYSAAELGWDTLKGPDHGRAHALRSAARRSGLTAFLARVSLVVEWSAEELHWRSRRHQQRTRYDGWGVPTDLELYDLVQERRDLTGWIDSGGATAELPDQPFADDELWPEGAIDQEAPDDVSYHEATGNEGASLIRAYRRAAVVLWPPASADRLVAQRGLAAVADAIETLDDDARICRMVLEAPRDEYPIDVRAVARTLRVLARRGLVAPFRDLLETYRWEDKYAGPVSTLVDALPEPAAAELLTLALGRISRWDHASAIAMLRRALPRATDPRLWRPALDHAAAHRRHWSLSGVQLAVLVALAWELDHPDLEAAVEASLDTDEGFNRGVDAALELHSHGSCPDPWRSRVVDELEARTAQVPRPPTDLARAPLTGCACADCSEVSRFLSDPTAGALTFAASQQRRGHVDGRLRTQRIDVLTREIRTGNPHKLVLTKTNARYEAAARRHAEHVDALEALSTPSP